MKELTIEQKAKAYDEAIERAKVIYQGSYKPDTAATIAETLQNVFPELCESEDEKIRKSLIILLQHFCKGYRVPGLEFPVSFSDMLAWLEKQGSEPNWCHHKVDLSDCSEEYRKAYYDGWNNCNQQHSQCNAEQNPAWSEEDKRMFDYALDMIEWYGGKNEKRVRLVSDWLKSLKQRVQPKQKLNEHDNYVIDKVLDWATFVNPTSSIFEKLPKKQFIESLKSLKQRIGG